MKKETEITIKSGKGGNGCISFRKEKFVPKGGPDGGDGGKGGNVIFISEESIIDLSEYYNNQIFISGNGGDGGKRNKNGKNGDDLVLRVPFYTDIIMNNFKKMIGKDEKVVLLNGGDGGKGNKSFKSSTNQEPLLAEAGELGKEAKLTLKMKRLPGVGIVGITNSGKSSLLNKLTNAGTKIASYPYTTHDVVLGVIETEMDRVKILEIPDFVTLNKLEKFKEYVETLNVIIITIDASDRPEEKLLLIKTKLKGLLKKETDILLCLTKTDKSPQNEIPKIIAKFSKHNELFIFNSEDEIKMVKRIIDLTKVAQYNNADNAELDEINHIPKIIREKIRYSFDKRNKVVNITDPWLIRVAQGSNLSKPEAQLQFHNILNRLGYLKKLEKDQLFKGVIVKLGEIEMEFT